MLRIEQAILPSLWDEACRAAPAEACGMLIDYQCNGSLDTIVSLHNWAPDPTQEFWMLPEEVNDMRSLFPRLAIWHSHPTSRWELSFPDRKIMVKTGLPMVVVAAKPWPSVVLYEMQNKQIVMVQNYQVEGVTV